jgi:ankyrin repeat protein
MLSLLVSALLAAGCKNNDILFESVESGEDATRRVLAQNVDLNQVDDSGRTPLHVAVMKGRTEAVRLLAANRSLLDVQDKHRETALHIAVRTNNIPCVDALLIAGANPEIGSGATRLRVLHFAALLGKEESMRLLLRSHADPNARTTWGESPLHVLAHVQEPTATTLASMLIEAGADFNARDTRGFTAIHLAALFDSLPLIRFAHERGYDINATSTWGLTPLDIALRHGSDRAAQLLFGLGARHDATLDVEPPLHQAARLDNAARASRILGSGADASSLSQGRSALDVAKASDSAEVVKLLDAHRRPLP